MGRSPVHRLAETIEDTPREVGANRHLRILAAGDDAVTQLDAIDLFEGHGEHLAVPEPHHLGADAAAVRGDHFAEISNCDGRAARSDEHAHHFDDVARPGQQVEAAHAGDVLVQVGKVGNRFKLPLRHYHSRASSWPSRPCSISAS